jgi:oligosaccharide repeat unit polymerase
MAGERGRHNQGPWATVVFVNFLVLTLLVLSALAYSTPTFHLPDERALFVATVSLFLVFVWTLWSWRALTGSLFNPYALFLMAAVLFNGGQTFLEILGLNEFDALYAYRDIYSRFSPATILETTFLVTVGLTAFHAGGLLSIPIAHKRSATREKIEAERRDSALTAKALRVVGWGLLAISIVPALLIMRERLAIVSIYGYLGLFQQYSASDALRILADAIVPATIFLLAGSRNSRFNIMVSGVTILSYCSALIFVGDRQGAAMLLLAWGWVYHRCIRPIPKTVLLGLATLTLFIVFPTVAVFRLESGPERFSLSSLLDAFSSVGNPIVTILQETGFSMATVAYTIELVPGYREFDMGMSYLYGMSTIIPNLFWEVHPVVAHGLLDDWLIQTVDPGVASSIGNSYGFSFIAEAYLNFGWIGAPLALGIMGFLLGWVVIWADRSANPAKVAMVGAFTAFFLVFARGESGGVFRYLVWYALIPYLGVLFLRSRSFAKVRRAGLQPRSAQPDPATRVGPGDVRRTSS